MPPLNAMESVVVSRVRVPPHVFDTTGLRSCNPPGRTSVKLRPVNALLPGVVLEIVKVNVVVLPTGRGFGLTAKDFEMVGGGGFAQVNKQHLEYAKRTAVAVEAIAKDSDTLSKHTP